MNTQPTANPIMKYHTLLSLMSVPVVGLGMLAPFPRSAAEPLEFETAAMLLELNATDGDAEIVLELKTDEELVQLELFGPVVLADGEEAADAGMKVISIRSSRQIGLGLSEILIETGEPSVNAVLEAYPAGTYLLRGKTLAGMRFENAIELTHALLAAPELVFPMDGDEGVPTANLTIQWLPDPGAVGWVIEVEQDELGVNVTAELPAGTSTFSVPNGFLVPGVEYEFGIHALHPDGNVIVTEGAFTTG